MTTILVPTLAKYRVDTKKLVITQTMECDVDIIAEKLATIMPDQVEEQE